MPAMLIVVNDIFAYLSGKCGQVWVGVAGVDGYGQVWVGVDICGVCGRVWADVGLFSHACFFSPPSLLCAHASSSAVHPLCASTPKRRVRIYCHLHFTPPWPLSLSLRPSLSTPSLIPSHPSLFPTHPVSPTSTLPLFCAQASFLAARPSSASAPRRHGRGLSAPTSHPV